MRHRAAAILSLATILAACGGAPPNPPESAPSASAPAASTASAPTPEAQPPEATARKRTRHGSPTPLAHDGTKPKNGRPLNPKDNLGRTVFVRADDQCFVEVPPKGATEVVDCPPAADDAAWDQCAAQIVLDEGGAKCFCVSGAGNPRPMPRPTPCPASAKSN